MQKILMILMILICMFIGSAHATEMCAKNNTVVIPLDATVPAEKNKTGNNGIEWIWWAGFPYGKIYGVATCLSSAEVANLLPSDSDEFVGRSGKDEDGNPRTQCYAKLIHPMSSGWALAAQMSEAECRSRCMAQALYLGSASDVVAARSVMFNSIGASMAEKEPEAETE